MHHFLQKKEALRQTIFKSIEQKYASIQFPIASTSATTLKTSSGTGTHKSNVAV